MSSDSFGIEELPSRFMSKILIGLDPQAARDATRRWRAKRLDGDPHAVGIGSKP